MRKNNKTNFKHGFSLAEAMITLLVVSLILAAIVPIVSKRQSTPDKIWNYTQTGVGSDQADIYWGLRDGQTALIGGFSVPTNAAGSRLTMITSADDSSIATESLKYAIRRPLVAFFQKSGAANTMIGKVSFDQFNNTALGKETLSGTVPTGTSDNQGGNNTAIGSYSLYNNSTGSYNVGVGSYSMVTNTTGGWNTAVGRQALYANNGSNNTGIGYYGLYSNSSGGHNVAIGDYALQNNTTGSYNVAIGSGAGSSVVGSYRLYIEGNGTTYNGANSLIYGSFDPASRYVQINGTLYNSAWGVVATSDKRLKTNIKDDKKGLEDILRLNVKSFTFRNDKAHKTHVGVIAQELQKIIPEAIVEGPGQGKYNKLLYVDQSYIIFELVNAVKQLHGKIVSNLNRIIVLENEVKSLKIQNSKLENENKKLNNEIKNIDSRLVKLEKK